MILIYKEVYFICFSENIYEEFCLNFFCCWDVRSW